MPDTATTSEEAASPPSKVQIMNNEQNNDINYILEMDALRRERDEYKKTVDELEERLRKCNLSVTLAEDNDIKSKMLTGLNWTMFQDTFDFLLPFVETSQSARGDGLSLKDQFLMTLVKLRQNPNFDFLAAIKSIPKSTAIKYFWKWVEVIHWCLEDIAIKPVDREGIYHLIPPCFKQKFPRLTCIIDCFEIFMESPRTLHARSQTYSHYKGHCTGKVFISCNPQGYINFISRVWGGRVSDIEIVRKSGFIDFKHHMPRDQILADRGFKLVDDFAAKCSVELIIPAFTRGHKQLPARDVERSRTIASVRIHIERVIGLMRNRFTILQGVLPLRSVKKLSDENDESAIASVDKIVAVCAILANLGEGIVVKPENNDK